MLKNYNERIVTFFINNPINLKCSYIFGQIDKTKLNYNVNYHRGKSVQACWCFCIVANYKTTSGYVLL